MRAGTGPSAAVPKQLQEYDRGGSRCLSMNSVYCLILDLINRKINGNVLCSNLSRFARTFKIVRKY